MAEAEWLCTQFRRLGIDLTVAQSVGDHYASVGYAEPQMTRFLQEMAQKPPYRSRQSQRYYQGLQIIWKDWASRGTRNRLASPDRARAWGWGIRLARVGR